MHRGKLIRMYKRPGHRVIINMDGDLIVRPTFAEASTQVPAPDRCRAVDRVLHDAHTLRQTPYCSDAVLVQHVSLLGQAAILQQVKQKHAFLCCIHQDHGLSTMSPSFQHAFSTSDTLHMMSQSHMWVQRRAAAVSHHLLAAYQKSLIEVIRAQLGQKAAPGGLSVRFCPILAATCASLLLLALKLAVLACCEPAKHTWIRHSTLLACTCAPCHGGPTVAGHQGAASQRHPGRRSAQLHDRRRRARERAASAC